MAYENDIRKATIEEILLETGIEGLGEAVGMLINEVMVLERSRYLNAAPYERSSERTDYANGFKAKKLKRRVLPLRIRKRFSFGNSPNPCSCRNVRTGCEHKACQQSG